MNVKQIVFLILGIIFLILGLIGLALPVIPQIPFLITAVVLFAGALPVFKKRLMGTKIYREHGCSIVQRFKILRDILGEEELEYMAEVAEEMSDAGDEAYREDGWDAYSQETETESEAETAESSAREK
ncbi:MAG: DUF454 family protein [Lachnospiraceae bacterium]|nr:DUF454 family protein [Lachnospiraceae bacterium]